MHFIYVTLFAAIFGLIKDNDCVRKQCRTPTLLQVTWKQTKRNDEAIIRADSAALNLDDVIKLYYFVHIRNFPRNPIHPEQWQQQLLPETPP